MWAGLGLSFLNPEAGPSPQSGPSSVTRKGGLGWGWGPVNFASLIQCGWLLLFFCLQGRVHVFGGQGLACRQLLGQRLPWHLGYLLEPKKGPSQGGLEKLKGTFLNKLVSFGSSSQRPKKGRVGKGWK